MDDKQQNCYKRLLINIRVKCLKQGIKKSEFCLKQGRKISDICLKQGQGMRGRAAPPHPGIYRVPPPPGARVCALVQFLTRNMSQHVATGWPNACNMFRSTMLRNVAFKCCNRLARACKCWVNNVGTCYVEMLLSFGRGFIII